MASAASQASARSRGGANEPPGSAHRPLGWTLFGAIAREAAWPTALALAGLSLAALTKSLLGLSDLLVNRGLSAVDTGAFLGFEIVVLAARILPFAVLLGALVALGRLAADKELLALESCGVSPGRLIGPVVAVGCLATLLGLAFSLAVVPAALAARERLLVETTLEQPGSVLRAGTVKKFGKRRLSALEASSRGDDLRGVLLHADDLDETFFAESAALRVAGPGQIQITLRDGLVITNAGGRSQLIRFKVFRTTLQGKQALGTPESDDGRFAAAPTRALWSLTPAPQEERAVRSELARRFSTPFAALALTWLAVPLALWIGAASRGAGGVVGLAVTVAYYGLLQASNGLLEFPDVPVAFAAWMPNVVAGVGGSVLMVRRFLLTREQRVRVRAPDARDVRSVKSRSGHRFPLTRYVARRFVTLSLLAIGVLLLAYLLVDVLEHLERFAEHGAQLAEVARFYAARLPLLASRVVPMGLLIGVALLVSSLFAEGELIGMEACGIRLLRGLASLLVVAALATPVYFLLLDRVLPKTNALADRIKDSEIKGRAPGGWEEDFWAHNARIALHVGALNAGGGMARQLTLYELGQAGLPETRLDARVAHYVGHERWRLLDSHQTIVGAAGLIQTTSPEVKRISSIESLSIDPMHEDLRGLARHIRESQQSGYDLTAFQVDFQSRLAAPLQCLILPWLGLVVALGVRRAAPTLLAAVGIGVGFILLSGVSAALGYGGWLPPVVAGWLPSGAVASAAAALQLRR